MEKIRFKHFVPIVNKAKSKDKDSNFLGYISGIAATNDLDSHNEIISEKALRAGAESLKTYTSVFKNHEWSEDPIGLVLESKYFEDDGTKGIMVKIGISKAEPDLWTRIEEGVYSTFSIGGFLLDYEYKELDNGDFVGIIKDMETVEVSVAGIPANINAQFGVTMKSAIKKQIELDNQAKVQKERIEKIMTDNVETEQTEPEVNPLTKQINEMKELVKAQVELQKAQMELQMAKMQADAVVLPDINKGGIAPVVEQEIPEPEVIKFGSMEEERNFDLVQLKRLMTSGQDLDIIVQG